MLHPLRFIEGNRVMMVSFLLTIFYLFPFISFSSFALDNIRFHLSHYPAALLNTVYEKGYLTEYDKPIKVVLDRQVNVARRINLLESNSDIDVLALAANHERMKRLQAIEIPLMFGFQGTRILIIREDAAQRFSNIRNLSDLRELQAGFIYGWADLKILTHNKVPTFLGSYRDGIYSMVEKERVDYFPRSALEIVKNHHVWHNNHVNLTIEKNIALYYPLPVYFFVNKQNQRLAKVLKRAMLKLQEEEGMFEVFKRYHLESLQKLKLHNRVAIELENPTIPQGVNTLSPFNESNPLFNLLNPEEKQSQ